MSFSPQNTIKKQLSETHWKEKWEWQEIFHQIFKCDLCKKFYDLERNPNQDSTSTQPKLKTFNIVHRKPDETIRCSKCGRIFKQTAYLRKHLKICIIKSKNIYKCKCDDFKLFATKWCLERHIDNKIQQCQERPCTHHFMITSTVRNGISTSNMQKGPSEKIKLSKNQRVRQAIPDNLICPICNKKFKTKSSYTTHKSKIHFGKESTESKKQENKKQS